MTNQKVARQRILNVIYFVDSAKTKSIQLTMSSVVALVVGLFVLIAWFLLSIWLAYSMIKERSHLLSLIRETRSTVFEYETRFDSIYENTYPSEGRRDQQTATNDQTAAAPTEAKTRPTLAPAKAPDKPATTPAVAAEKSVPVAAKPTTAAVKEASASPAPATKPEPPPPPVTASEQSVLVESPVFKGSPDSLELRVNINNLDKRRKAEGYVWAVATYKSDSGEESFVAAPKSLQINANGETTDPRNAQRYAIQFHKPKNFLFGSPKPGDGKFTQVKIVLQDYSGQRQEFKFPVTSN